MLELMEQTGALLKGHFLLTSGLHSEFYMQCALLLRFPEHASYMGNLISGKVRSLEPEIIAAPAIGGLIIGHEVARSLGLPFIFCERESGKMVLRRFPVPEGKRVLVVEDVITTGGSVREVGELLEDQGCTWVGSSCIVDRSGGDHVLPDPPVSLCKVKFPLYGPSECPLCDKGLELVKPGSRQFK
ncbi:MAG TPA: orotate phosphoribosyltransferase [Synergistales bacterium]|nr:orotate phosphoribosyltransferase [Synergistales bacterium]